MLADFYIPRRSNDMKFAVQKNDLRGQFCTDNSVKKGVKGLKCFLKLLKQMFFF